MGAAFTLPEVSFGGFFDLDNFFPLTLFFKGLFRPGGRRMLD
jgi:hypothetical protein